MMMRGLDRRRQQVDRRLEAMLSDPGDEGRRHQQLKITRLDDLQLLAVQRGFEARPGNETQTNAARDQ